MARYHFEFVYRRLTQRVKRRCGPFSFSDSDAVGPSASTTVTLPSQATLWALLLQRQRRCGPFCFNDSDAAESSDAVGPSASATVDKFEAVPGHSFLAMLRDATLSSACKHREKAESSYQPASTWEAKVSCASAENCR